MNSSVTATFNEAMTASTISASTVELRDAGSALVASTVTYAASTRTVTLQPGTALAYSSTYTATRERWSSGVKDVAGNALAGNYVWSFTTVGQPAGAADHRSWWSDPGDHAHPQSVHATTTPRFFAPKV